MALAAKRWYRARRNQIFMTVVVVTILFYYILIHDSESYVEQNIDLTRRYIESKLQDALKEDKGTVCEIPKLNPFSKEVIQFDKEVKRIVCDGKDWVKCYMSKCKVVPEILQTTSDIICTYKDIIYMSDNKYILGSPTVLRKDEEYTLVNSDQVKIICTGKHNTNFFSSKWVGYSLGFRTTTSPKKPPPGREKSLNVLILGFDSTAKNGFIRRMPKSYGILRDEMKATILNGYNIVGDGTPASLFPILTGKTELELPECRKSMKGSGNLDQMPFIFYKLKEDGYRTAYFEDMPWIGTFQYRFNGFLRQPADHYLRAFYLEESGSGYKWFSKSGSSRYCVGDTPQYKLMLNITDQFFRQDGKRFAFTFIADITHDDFNMIATADDDFAVFLRDFQRQGRLQDTMVFIMGDHGPRYANVRDTYQGKLEERLPLMAIMLPEQLKRDRPDIQLALDANVEALTTPHDIHATILDVIGLTQYYNHYKVQGADLLRGMTLLEPIPRNRSCSEAGIEPHWCACLKWENVSADDAIYTKAAVALVDHINSLTKSVRNLCVPRTLKSIEWLMRQRANNRMMAFKGAKDFDGYVGKFEKNMKLAKENYQIKIVVGPGTGIYEASMTFMKNDSTFDIDTREISRTNAYNKEPSCISNNYPHLNMFCYCKDMLVQAGT